MGFKLPKIIIADKRSLTSFLVCTAICSLAGLFSSFHWFFDLFNHFRPQAVLVGAVILIPMLFFKNQPYILLALAVITLNSALIVERIYAFNRTSPSDVSLYSNDTISIISSNVHTENPDHDSIVRLVKEQQPDIFVAIEVDDSWIKSLKGIENSYPYTLKYPRQDNFGMAIYSKMPFQGTVLDVGNHELPLMLVNFQSFVLMALHPLPPMRSEGAAEMPRYFAEVTRTASQTKKPLIVVGDMNTTFWSDNARPFIAAGLTPANPSGIAWTWPEGFLPFAIQIDHVFVRDALVRSFQVLEGIGSDHAPIKSLVSILK